MRRLPRVFSHLNINSRRDDGERWSAPYKVDEVAASQALRVETYDELVKKVAQILHRHRNLTLFYRGQKKDYKADGKTSILPIIYRKSDDKKILDLKNRFEVLKHRSQELVSAFNKSKIKFAGTTLINKYPEITWSILQHYGVCYTPLLDITHSLHVACSFAFDENHGKTGVIYVLGMPWVTDSIGYNTYEELVNIRLLSVCPPQATRPFFQEGYLTGPFPNYRLDDPARKDQFDFARRLIGKFEIPITDKFWGSGFNRIPNLKLYPIEDRIFELCRKLK